MDSIVQPRCTRQPAEMNNMDLHESSSDGSAMGFSCSKTSSPPLVSAHSTSLLQRRTHRPRTDFISSTNAAPGSCSSACTPCPLLNPAPSYSLPHAATPVCSYRPSGSEPGRLSPAPASTFVEVADDYFFLLMISLVNRNIFYLDVYIFSLQGDVPGQLKPPGAVIDSVTSHSPGVFSGTFSGKFLLRCGL